MKTVGVIGGMGPKATLDFLNKVVSLTPAKKDQQHLKMVVYMNPQIPDRTAAIIGKGKSPAIMLSNTAKDLEQAGADFIVIPCVAAHHWLDIVRKAVKVPVLSIVEASVRRIKREKIKAKKIGILGTTGVIKSKLFEKIFEPQGYKIVVPDKKEQRDYVMKGIYQIKEGREPAQLKDLFLHSCAALIKNSVQLIILACTEIPLSVSQDDIMVPVIDVNEALARETVECALKS